MFKTIVLATDLSPAWNEIVACAGEFKALGCKQVILTYVISVKFMAGMEGILQSAARPKLAAQQQQLEAQGLQVTVEIPMGLPADSLNEIACRYGADLIVVGSHGQSLWREGVLGCFTSAVLHNARYPVLLLNVRLKTPGEPGSCQISHSRGAAPRALAHGLFGNLVPGLGVCEAPGGQRINPGHSAQRPGRARRRGGLSPGLPGDCRGGGPGPVGAMATTLPGGWDSPKSTITSPLGIPCWPFSGSWNPRISRSSSWALGERIHQGDFPGQRGP